MRSLFLCRKGDDMEIFEALLSVLVGVLVIPIIAVCILKLVFTDR